MEHYDDMPKKIKKILIISYAFPPSTAVGAVRLGALYKFLTKQNYDVTVISSNKSYRKKENIENEEKPTYKFKPSTYLRSIDRTIFSNFVYSNLKKLFFSKEEYDVVIASYKPIGNLIIGIFYKVFNKKTKLIIELRDLISQFGRKKRVFVLHFIDSLIDKIFISFSNHVVVVSPLSQKKAEMFYKRKVNLILNGIDKKIDFNKKKSKSVKILYSGTLSEVRNLDKICSHIKKSKMDIELIIASNQNPKFYGGNYGFVKHIGFVSRKLLEQKIKQVDFLLILEGFDENSSENIPAKLFEYLSYKIPVIANCNEKSEIINILEETESGKNVNDYNTFINYIHINNFKPNQLLKNYLRENQFKKYLDLIEN